MKRGQIAIEYLFLLAFSIAFFVVLVYGLIQVSAAKSTEKSFVELDDFARSVQQEIILAATVQDGYERVIIIPTTFNNRAYSLTILNNTVNDMLLEFSIDNRSLYYRIPDVQGSIGTGTRTIRKVDGVVFVS